VFARVTVRCRVAGPANSRALSWRVGKCLIIGLWRRQCTLRRREGSTRLPRFRRRHSCAVTDLFTPNAPAAPLADRLRPKPIAEVIGQRHLLAPGKPLAVAFAAGKPHSMILWGPPGVGKTTIARLMADAFNAEFIALSAVLSGVKDIRDAVARAEAI